MDPQSEVLVAIESGKPVSRLQEWRLRRTNPFARLAHRSGMFRPNYLNRTIASVTETGKHCLEHISQTNAEGCGEGMQRGEMNAGCGRSPRCRMQKKNAGFGRRGERRVGDGSREQN